MFWKIAEFQEAFLLYDNRGDGRIPVSLIGDVIRALGQNPTESEVKKLVHEHRADERVTFEVFLPILQVRNIHEWACYRVEVVLGVKQFVQNIYFDVWKPEK